jgi:putative FmdB family regulatory protein
VPSYDFRCKDCGNVFQLTYKTVRAYEAAERLCPRCESADLARLISRVNIARPGRDYANMSSNEMLSVMESGDSRAMGELFRQVGETVPGGMDAQYQQVTDRLSKGEPADSVESDLRRAAEQQADTEKKRNQSTGGDGGASPDQTR